jgi:hemoglobin/transferrin/lactoferrin receptor protein
VERINGIDSIVKNTGPHVQRFSGYGQFNFLQKIRFKPSDNFDLQYSFSHSKTGNAPRYDRLIQYRNQKLRYAEWYYGPMILNMHIMQIALSKKNSLYDAARIIASFQDYKESRIERTLSSTLRNRQDEMVEAISGNFDATKAVGKVQFFYGIEYVNNKVGSTGTTTNINNGLQSPLISRYPDGSRTNSSSMYGSYKINVNTKITLSAGLRYSYNTLYASFDTTFIKFPYQKAVLKEGGLTGSAGLVYRPNEKWQLNSNISTGYRMPNVDDIGKLFESLPGRVSVPNPDLKSEYAWNFEIGIVKNIPEKFRLELSAFYTILNDAITRRPFTFKGQDSIAFGGIKSRVEALQNIAKATVNGLQASIVIFFAKGLSLQTHANWIDGKETDDTKNEQVALRHAPPFYGSTLIKYRLNKLYAEASANYNSKINSNDLAPSEKAKTEIYAKDQNGQPFSPGWYTISLKTSYQATKNLMVTTCWENVMNKQYRPYSSGIVSAGSNFIVSLRVAM